MDNGNNNNSWGDGGWSGGFDDIMKPTVPNNKPSQPTQPTQPGQPGQPNFDRPMARPMSRPNNPNMNMGNQNTNNGNPNMNMGNPNMGNPNMGNPNMGNPNMNMGNDWGQPNGNPGWSTQNGPNNWGPQSQPQNPPPQQNWGPNPNQGNWGQQNNQQNNWNNQGQPQQNWGNQNNNGFNQNGFKDDLDVGKKIVDDYWANGSVSNQIQSIKYPAALGMILGSIFAMAGNFSRMFEKSNNNPEPMKTPGARVNSSEAVIRYSMLSAMGVAVSILGVLIGAISSIIGGEIVAAVTSVITGAVTAGVTAAIGALVIWIVATNCQKFPTWLVKLLFVCSIVGLVFAGISVVTTVIFGGIINLIKMISWIGMKGIIISVLGIVSSIVTCAMNLVTSLWNMRVLTYMIPVNDMYADQNQWNNQNNGQGQNWDNQNQWNNQNQNNGW